MYIGAHISIAGGIFNAPENAGKLDCEVIQIFTRSPRGGKAPEFTPEVIKKFKSAIKQNKIKNTYIHTPYYINFASANNRISHGSISAVRDELERGSLIGAKYIMTHLGTAKDLEQKEAIKKTIKLLKKTLEDYKGKTKLILENSAGAGEIIGGNLKELSEIISGVNSPSIAGICLDTQHSFASGYDWRNFNKTIEKIDQEIGINKIKLIHANDSLTECGSNKDRHAHIGEGEIGLEAFKNITAFAKKNNIDMILETKHDKVMKDIKLLKKLRN